MYICMLLIFIKYHTTIGTHDLVFGERIKTCIMHFEIQGQAWLGIKPIKRFFQSDTFNCAITMVKFLIENILKKCHS